MALDRTPRTIRPSAFIAAAAFMWPYVTAAVGETVRGRRVAAVAAALMAAGRLWVGIRAFEAESRAGAFRRLRRGAVAVVFVGVVLVPVDVPSTLSPGGLRALLTYAVVRVASALVYASLVGVFLWPLVVRSRRVGSDRTALVAGLCGALPYAATSAVPWIFARGRVGDAGWRQSFAYGVVVPLIAGLAGSIMICWIRRSQRR
jgi:hypothetical protein